MRYINPRFTYLLNYLLSQSNRVPQFRRDTIVKYRTRLEKIRDERTSWCVWNKPCRTA